MKDEEMNLEDIIAGETRLKHHSGRIYKVEGIANTAHPSYKFPISLVYRGESNRELWTRAFESMKGKFEIIRDKPEHRDPNTFEVGDLVESEAGEVFIVTDINKHLAYTLLEFSDPKLGHMRVLQEGEPSIMCGEQAYWWNGETYYCSGSSLFVIKDSHRLHVMPIEAYRKWKEEQDHLALKKEGAFEPKTRPMAFDEWWDTNPNPAWTKKAYAEAGFEAGFEAGQRSKLPELTEDEWEKLECAVHIEQVPKIIIVKLITHTLDLRKKTEQ